MRRATLTSVDLDSLRDVVDTANDTSGAPAVDVTFAVLDRIREMIGADFATFHDMQGSVQRVRHLQGTDGEEYFTEQGEEDGTHDAFWTYYQASSCSWPDHQNRPMVISNKDVCSEREWAQDPMHLEYQTDVHDEIMAASPYGPRLNLRLLISRSERPLFSDLDCFLVQLLQPHLQPLFRRTLRSVVPPSEPALTERQREILRLVRGGSTNRQVAHQLGISPGTVRKHLENAFARLNVQSRVAAVGVAFPERGYDLQA
ncbi:MAG: helix-turn-helix transcriptional regulator [Ornithinimicrobium sp.]